MTEKDSRHSLCGLRVQISFDVVRLIRKISEHSRTRSGVIRKRLKNGCLQIAFETLDEAENIFVSRAAKIRPVRVAGYPIVLFLVGVWTRSCTDGVKAFGNAVARHVNRLNVQLRVRLKRKNKQARAKAQENM